MSVKVKSPESEAPQSAIRIPHSNSVLLGEEGKILQLIVFTLGDQEFGAAIDQVREIITAGVITPIPDSPDFIRGITNVRGEITVVIDLKARFLLPIEKDVGEKHIVITQQENNLFGLMVDEVAEVLRIPQSEINATPELVTRIDRVYISGVLTLENRLIIMLDLTKVLSEEELTRLSADVSRRSNGPTGAKAGSSERQRATAERAKKCRER